MLGFYEKKTGKESEREIEVPFIRIEGYDEYVKDYERLVQNKEENRLYTEEEIREEMEVQYRAGRKMGCGIDSFGIVLDVKPREEWGFDFDGTNSNPEEENYFVRYNGIIDYSQIEKK